MVFTTTIQPYQVYEYAWTSSLPTDHEIELGGLANSVSFIETPTNCSVRLESEDNGLISGVEADDKIDGIPFTKILLTSPDLNGSIKFFAAWIN